MFGDDNDDEDVSSIDDFDDFHFQSDITSVSIRNGILMVGAEGPFIHFIEEKTMTFLSSLDLSSQVGQSSILMFPSWKKKDSDISHHSFGDQILRS